MGRQSARIYFNGQDHKEMVIWDGEKYVYHDKAYIWKNGTFELVWEKLYGLKLLYESELSIKPVSSQNNKYLYWTENSDDSTIYRLTVDAREPEKEEWYTSNKFNLFSAPTSSRGIGIHAEQNQTGFSYDYKILNLETGESGHENTFNFEDDTGIIPVLITPPILTSQTASKVVEHSRKYQSILGGYLRGQGYQYYNFLYNTSTTGISAMLLDNRDGDGSYIDGLIYDIGRISEDDSDPRSLLPRFIRLGTVSGNENVIVLEYGQGTEYGMYTAQFGDDIPFSFIRVAGGGIASQTIKTTRGNKLPVLADDLHIWIIQVNDDDIDFIDTDIESPSRYSMFDICPDFKYAMIFEDLVFEYGSKIVKIMDIESKKVVVNLNDEIHDLAILDAYFVGHNCIFVSGYYNGTYTIKNRLYKWR